jgi:14-3-3 protein epsilon
MGDLSDFGTDLSVEKLLTLARVAETAERYSEMCEFTSALVKKKCAENKDLEVEERNLLSVAFKNVVGNKRASWRTLNAEADDVPDELLTLYKARVEKELKAKCDEVLTLLKESLIPQYQGKKNESEVFYLKMAADYYRYLAEFEDGDENAKAAEQYYQKALDVATEALNETHPTRLGLALNFSVCYYEILKKPDLACNLAKSAFDAAIAKLDTLSDSSYKDSTLIMQLLRDNLTLWTSSGEDDED